MHAKRRTQPQGIVSLLALILMATVTATSVGAASVILNELRQTESIDQSISAAYAAETGVEDGLYLVKNRRQIQSLASTETVLEESSVRQAIQNGSSWSRTADLENQFIVTRLPADTTAHLDIFDPDNVQGSVNIQSLKIDWNVNCNNVVQLEVSMLTWEVSGSTVVFDPSSQQVYKETRACGQNIGENMCDTITMNSINGRSIQPGKPYRFNFRVLVPENTACLAENLTVTAFDGQDASGTMINLPTRIQLKSTGGFSRSRQALTASVPWRAPISGLLNFVIFSDESVEK